MLEPVERKMLYALLSVLFRQPDEQTLAAVEGITEETFQTVFPGLAAPPLATVDELQEGYRRLFATPADGVPPYGSVYLEKVERNGHSARLVANLYASAGLGAASAGEAPDYLPTELEFLYYLTEGEEQSRAQRTSDQPQRWIASQADFFHNFFAPWIEPFCTGIEAHADALPFYRWSARLLHRFVDSERQRLKAV